MKRGDIILIALQGDFGKPRPAVVVQSDVFNDAHPSVIVCPVTSELHDTPLFRITLEPSECNGLKKLSQVMADKPQTIRRDRCGRRIGELESEHMLRLGRSLMMFMGLP